MTRSPSSPDLDPIAQARGVLRDALAALRNLEHLLRSPRVGPKALAQVIPGLRDLCDPLSASADEVRVRLGEPQAASQLADFLRDASGRLRSVLDWAVNADMDAKSRLSFESQVQRMVAELSTARRLLDLMVRAAERADTELDIAEVMQVSFAGSTRGVAGPIAIKVVSATSGDTPVLHASVQVIAPLVGFGVALVQRGPDIAVAVHATSAEQVVTIAISRASLEGDVHVFQPPLVIPPVVACARAAAELGGGRLTVGDDMVQITWPCRPRSTA
jgi:hypothetical protein